MLIPASALRRTVHVICRAAGCDDKEATLVAEQLIEANLQGHDSHGIGMLPQYIQNVRKGTLKPNQHIKILSDRGSILSIDGQWGFGQTIGTEAMAAGIAKARDTGMALVALRNSHHLGRIGTWAEQCLKANFVSMHFVNVIGSPPRVAPYGGSDARFGTNPVCIGVPAGEGAPVVLDLATSRIAMGKARVAKNKGEQVKDGCLIDWQGNPTREPKVVFDPPIGALLPFGDHKGSGFALICELLGAALTGGITIPPGREQPSAIINNMLSIIVDPGALGSAASFRAEVERVKEWVKASPPAPGTKAVMVAGEPERAMRARRMAEGIPVDAETWREIVEAAQTVGVERSALASPGAA
jgi:hydroxycarboxylate dehydrogenase B